MSACESWYGLAEKIVTAIRADSKAWSQDPRRLYCELTKFLSPECVATFKRKLTEMAEVHAALQDGTQLDCTEGKEDHLVAEIHYFEARGTLPRLMTWDMVRQTFWAIRMDVRLPLSVRDEAAEVDHACLLLTGLKPTQVRTRRRGSGPGRICRFCWRTERERGLNRGGPAKGALGLCHLHDDKQLPPTIDPASLINEEKLAAAWLEHKIQVRRRVDRAQDLLRLAKQKDKTELDHTKKRLTAYDYPMNRCSDKRLTKFDKTVWRMWVQEEYPLSAEYLIDGGRSSALATPLKTLEALEDRPLTHSETEWMESHWFWDVGLARSEAWQHLIQSKSAT